MKSILICVAGASASGKSTVVNKIISKFDKKDVLVIHHDDYYKDNSNLTMEERVQVNYDHPSSLDYDLFYTQLCDLLAGKSIMKPTYNFVLHNRNKEYELTEPAKIIIAEGILVLDDPRIRDLADIKLFVESDEDTCFIRRLKRDINERGRTIDQVIDQYLKTVKPMYYAFVKPTKRYADMIIPNDNSHDVAVKLIIRMIKDMIAEREQ